MEISLLASDLARWDQADEGPLLAVPVYTDVRPPRGATGLADWRLCGELSRHLRDGTLRGELGETLVLPATRLPWRAVLAFGVGARADLGEERSALALGVLFAAMRELELDAVALALPGRDGERVPPARALARLQEVAPAHGPLRAITVIDVPAALKVMAEALGLAPAPRAAAR